MYQVMRRVAWMNDNTDGGWLRAYGQILGSDIDQQIVAIKVCLQNQLGTLNCGPWAEGKGAVQGASPQVQCASGRGYRSFMYWQWKTSKGNHASHWWTCP
jgi:hypothetical protein